MQIRQGERGALRDRHCETPNTFPARGTPRRDHARKADELPCFPGHRAAGVHVDAVLPTSGRRPATRPRPSGPRGTVRHPERVRPWDPGVDQS